MTNLHDDVRYGGLSLSDESFPNEGARGAFAKPSRSLQEGSAKLSRRVPSRRLRAIPTEASRRLREAFKRASEAFKRAPRSLLEDTLHEGFAEPPRRHHEPFAEVYEPFAEVAHTEGSTTTPWRVHEASSKGPWMNCMFLLDHDCNRVWSILYCF